jgi:Tfp pilus assembly protein PilZ
VKVEQLPIETTVYSMSGEPPVDSNRRADERLLTLFRVGTIVIGDKRELCLVKNISAGGTLIRAYCTLKPDMAVHIELKQGQSVPGKVTWIRGTDAGITFAERIDVIELLKSGGEGPRPRMPRIEAKCVCFVREGATVHRSTMHNISQGGLSVETANPLKIGADVTVSIPGMEPQGAVVRWKDGDRYGVSFNSVLPLAGLVAWLHERSGPIA